MCTTCFTRTLSCDGSCTEDCRNPLVNTKSCTVGCRNPLVDPDHCGSCGNACTSGVCKDGKCASVECPVDPDIFTPRRCGERCACFSTQAGGAFCGFDQECAGLIDCEEDSDCPTGALCASRNACPDQFLNCCTRKVCLNRCEDGYLEAKQVPDAFNISEFSGALASGQNTFYPYSYG